MGLEWGPVPVGDVETGALDEALNRDSWSRQVGLFLNGVE